MAKKEQDEFEVVMPQVWKPTEEEESIQGTLVDKGERGGKYNSTRYTLETEEGYVLVFGTTVLDNRMKLVNVGDYIRIKFLGTETNKKGNDTKLFEIGKRTVVAEA